MNAKETYNALIHDIELGASDRYTSKTELMNAIADKYALYGRELNAVMKFMTGETALNYIASRKLMASYRFLIESSRLNIKAAIEISGFDNHSSYCKKFAETFQFSPKEAFQQKDLSFLSPPMTWDLISRDNQEKFKKWEAAR